MSNAPLDLFAKRLASTQINRRNLLRVIGSGVLAAFGIGRSRADGPPKDTMRDLTVVETRIIPVKLKLFEKLCVMHARFIDDRRRIILRSIACTPDKDGRCRSFSDCEDDAKKRDIFHFDAVWSPKGKRPVKGVTIQGKAYRLITETPRAIYTNEDAVCASTVRASGDDYKLVACPGLGLDKELLICPSMEKCLEDPMNDEITGRRRRAD